VLQSFSSLCLGQKNAPDRHLLDGHRPTTIGPEVVLRRGHASSIRPRYDSVLLNEGVIQFRRYIRPILSPYVSLGLLFLVPILLSRN